MIARPLPVPMKPTLPVPVVGGRAGRIAVLGRRKAGIRRRYRALVGVCTWISAITTVVIVYLLLLANVTRVGYELARANRERLALQDQTMRLDDKIARLKSRDRLDAVARELGMHDPTVYAVVRLPQPSHVASREHGLAFLSAAITGITGWIR